MSMERSIESLAAHVADNAWRIISASA